MAGWVTTDRAPGVLTVAEVERRLRAAGLEPRTFRNAPGDRYPEHDHPRHKILFCIAGSITFHTGDGELAMSRGDRLDLEPGTVHGAVVGADGVVCTEAYADGPVALPAP